MKTLPAGVIQGSDAWKAARRGAFTASELPAAAGVSKYMSRAEMLKQKHSGIEREIDGNTQVLFNKGHAAEAAARVFAEEIIGEPLSPVTGYIEVDGMKLLASFDGITFDGDVIWEHKLWSEKLAEQVRSANLEPHYRLQLDQQLLVSGAEKCLFMVSDGTDERLVVMWYESEADDDAIIAVWKQFANDLGNYQPVEQVEKPVADAIMNLPALAVQATGMVTNSNLPQFKAAAENYIAGISTDLQTDEDFVNAEATVKFCKQTEETLEVTKKAILAQTATIDEVIRTVDYIQAQLRDKRLMLDKLVKSEKENRKAVIVQTARMLFNDYVLELESETKPIRILITMPVFADAIRGLKKLSAMQEAVDTMLRDSKFAADRSAKGIRAKLSWCKENAAGMSFLFPDLQQIIGMEIEAFTATITNRIRTHKDAEAEREAVARAHIEAEAKAKAEAAALAELTASQERIRAEERAKVATEQAVLSDKVEADAKACRFLDEIKPAASVSPIKPRPTDAAIIRAIIKEFSCTNGQACDWIIEAAERMQQAA